MSRWYIGNGEHVNEAFLTECEWLAQTYVFDDKKPVEIGRDKDEYLWEEYLDVVDQLLDVFKNTAYKLVDFDTESFYGEDCGLTEEQFNEISDAIAKDLESGDIIPDRTWYAIQYDPSDDDWGSGTYEREEAYRWLKEAGLEGRYARIAIIKGGLCGREILVDEADDWREEWE